MTEIVIIITCIVVVAFIAYNFFKGKNGGDNNLLSSQLADLIVRFSKVEEERIFQARKLQLIILLKVLKAC